MKSERFRPLPPRDCLLAVFHYDPESGKLFWKHRIDASKSWNSKWTGKEAGNLNKLGYRYVAINNVLWASHRIIWKMVYGDEPELIDHKNRVTDDNRLHNLRSCSRAQNGANRIANSNKVERLPLGVTRHYRKFQAKYGRKYIGLFDTVVEAQEAVYRARYEQHGEFARYG